MNNIIKNISKKWIDIIIKKKKDKEILENIINKTENCTPPPELWFEWARLTSIDNIKIIIIGQDPYPTYGTAHGLAFSALNTYPDSLRNIFKCLEYNKLIKNHKETNTSLISWAEQGVLLLNTSLSTEINKRRAHYDLWNEYMQKILVRILQYHIDSGLIIMCWGKDAQNLISKITNNVRHKFHILEWCHPSPLNGTKFYSCNHFNYANELLIKLDKTPINWASIENKNIIKSEDIKIENINTISIFTDGSAVGKYGKNKKDVNCKGGYSAIFIGLINGELLGNLDTSKYFASNIRAEGQAFISALDKCLNILQEKTQINIYSDSEFWIKMILEYMPKWPIDKFTKKENSDLTIKLWNLWKEINLKHIIKLYHIYSHNKSGLKESTNPDDQFKYINNERADKLADEARKTLKNGEEIWR
jgi:uracil-DNA glycosylase